MCSIIFGEIVQTYLKSASMHVKLHKEVNMVQLKYIWQILYKFLILSEYGTFKALFS